LIEALELLKRYANNSQLLYPSREKVPLQGVVPPAIEEIVVHKDAKGNQHVDRINYEICILREVRERLRCKEIWVVGADRYRNPDEDLLQDFDAKRDNYYTELGQPRDVEVFIASLQHTMSAAIVGGQAAGWRTFAQYHQPQSSARGRSSPAAWLTRLVASRRVTGRLVGVCAVRTVRDWAQRDTPTWNQRSPLL
jgi:hypothetical protein